MSSTTIPCACGMKGCETKIEICEDTEIKQNLLFKIDDGKHDFPSFVSIDHSMAVTITNALRRKFKGL